MLNNYAKMFSKYLEKEQKSHQGNEQINNTTKKALHGILKYMTVLR